MCAAHEFPQLVLSANGGLMLCGGGLLRNLRVVLEYDLAELYGVETRALKQAVRRNLDRFPADFMFELVGEEVADMVSQNVIPGRGKLGGGRPPGFQRAGGRHAIQQEKMPSLTAPESGERNSHEDS